MDTSSAQNEDEQIENEFKKLVDYFNKPPETLNFSQSDLLKLYGYYKVAVLGECKGPRPGIFKIKDRLKYDAWKKCGNMSKLEAMKKYIEFAKQLVPELRMKTNL